MKRISQLVRDLRTVLGTLKGIPALAAMILAATLLDLLGVALILPYLSLVTSTSGSTWSVPLTDLELGSQHVNIVGLTLVLLFVVKAIAAYALNYRIALFTQGARARLVTRLLAAYQSRPYIYHLQRNSSELINTVLWYTNQATSNVLEPALRTLSEGMILLALIAFLTVLDPRAVVLMVFGLAPAYLFVSYVTRPRLAAHTRRSAMLNQVLMQSVSQALAGIREVRLLGREAFFRSKVTDAANGLRDTAAHIRGLQMTPRYSVEVAIVTVMVIMATIIHITTQGNPQTYIPLLGAFALAAFRLLPASTSIIAGITQMRASRFALTKLVDELRHLPDVADAKTRDAKPTGALGTTFQQIALHQVTFSYRDGEAPALRNVALRINAGEVIGVMGPSGAGKSTLADVLLGLLQPQAGDIYVNGVDVHKALADWHAMVAYIPQSVYLIDDTVRRNVAFGLPDDQIDDAKVLEALQCARLGEFVAALPQALDTRVGERGTRLSGGQRQRIAIARALYLERTFLVLDEATSALDEDTERDIVESVGSLKGRATMVIIAHRRSTLAHADRHFLVADGEVSEFTDAMAAQAATRVAGRTSRTTTFL